MVGAEIDLVLGEDHPLGHGPAQLAPLECQPVRQRRPGERDGHRGSGAEVPGAADDLIGLVLTHVDPAELEPVGIRMLVGFEDAADPEEREVSLDAALLDPVHLGSRDRERVRDLLGGCVDAGVLA